MFNPAMLFLALEARRRGAGGAEIAPLLLPLPGPTGAMLSAVSTIRAQDRMNAMQKEMLDLDIRPGGQRVSIDEKSQPQMTAVATRSSRVNRAEQDRRWEEQATLTLVDNREKDQEFQKKIADVLDGVLTSLKALNDKINPPANPPPPTAQTKQSQTSVVVFPNPP